MSKTFDKLGLRKGLEELNTWGDNIAKRVGSTYVMPEKDGIPEIKNPRNKERLVAFLRDDHAVESVALLYLLNNYFRIDISVQVNTFDTNDVEFAIVSYKYPSEIAHNFLHLFGAADLYKTLSAGVNAKSGWRRKSSLTISCRILTDEASKT